MNEEEYKKRLEWYEKRYGPYFEKRGIHNYKNLFRKPNQYEWIILLLLALTLFMSYAYNAETKICRETLSNLDAIACETCRVKNDIIRMNELNNRNVVNNLSEGITILTNLTQNQRGQLNE